jgi:DNA-binding FadR family transcriptional regulator
MESDLRAHQYVPVSLPRTAEAAAGAIRLRIHLGELQPGARLPAERAFAEWLGVSRATLREAIKILQGEGYLRVDWSARRNIVCETRQTVEILRPQLIARLPELLEIFEVRAAVESAGARLAAERRTDQHVTQMKQAIEILRVSASVSTFIQADSSFHEAIAEASGNSKFLAIITEARASLFEATGILEHDAALAKSIEDHSEILRHIHSGDADLAGQAMAAHIQFAREEMLSLLQVK